MAAAAADHLLSESKDTDFMSNEIVLDLGGPTLMDEWGPKIAEMRAERVKWIKIVEITGLDLNRAYRSWKRFVDTQQKLAKDVDAEENSKDSGEAA